MFGWFRISRTDWLLVDHNGAMKLTARDGRFVELAVLGYQSGAAGNWFDANWLVVLGRAHDGKRACTRHDQHRKAENHRERPAQDEPPFIFDLFPKPDRADDREDAVE